jgi:hypothetical protein
MNTISQTRADRLLEEFEEAAYVDLGVYNISRGIAALLRHIAATESGYGNEESFCAVRTQTLEDMADKLDPQTEEPN